MRHVIIRYGMLGAILFLLHSPAWGVEFQKSEIEDYVEGPTNICTIDLDSDGDMDVVASVSGAIRWWENDGTCHFTLRTVTTSLAGSICAADFNGDGDIDIASTKSNGISWLENDGSENFTIHDVDNNFYSARSLRARDIENDNDVDLIVVSKLNGRTWGYRNNGSGGFSGINIDPVGTNGPVTVDAGDLDNDNDIDVIVGSIWWDAIFIFRYNQAYGNYYPRATLASNFIEPTEVLVVDLDQDGDNDVLASAEGSDEIAWFENAGSFTKHTIASGFDGAQSVVAADMDNDGDLDVVGCAKEASDIVWWENDGSENFTAHDIDDNYGGVIDVMAADLDGDGDIDVVAPTYGGDRIDWWENNPLYWNQHFSDGTPGAQPAGWYDESDDGAMNAQIAYAATDSLAEVSTVSGAEWGKVLSYSADVNLNRYSTLEVTISAISSGTAKIAVFSLAGGWEEHLCSTSISTPGTYSFDIPTASGWSGVKNLGVELISEGGNCIVTFDQVRIHREGMPSPTPTPTLTPTPTPTPSNAYFEHFVGTQGEQPANWIDETDDSNFNAEIACAATSSLAAVTRTADSNWGKVLSPVIGCNVSEYGYVEVSIASVTPDTSWKIGIQEAEGSWSFYDLSGSQTAAGTYKYNYAAATGWSGTHAFRVQLTIEGASDKAITVDWVRVGGETTVMGAVCIPPTWTPTATSTLQPTLTPTPESTAQVVLNTHTPTASPTYTATPFVAVNQVLAYPNPARGRVDFAYTVAGAGKVTIDIYKVTGERVATITEHVNGGTGQTLRTAWDAVDVAPGVYLCRIVITDGSGQVILNEKKKVALIQ